MSHQLNELFGQLENCANQGLNKLETAKLRQQQLETENLQLKNKVLSLESQLAKLGQALQEDAQLLNKADALRVLIQETLGLSPSLPAAANKNSATPLDKLKPEARLAHWVKTYPQVFMPHQPQPLKIGIHDDLHTQEGGDLKKIHRALACYVKVPRYLRCLKTGSVRLNLQGHNAGFVSQTEADFAANKLAELLEQKQLKRQQQNKLRSAKKAQQQEKRLQTKLNSLVNKQTN